MPFREHFSYRARDVIKDVLIPAARLARRRAKAPRTFSNPESVDVPGPATVITDEIVRGIIESHIFIADVTFQNAGVLLETGIALGTKPADQIILITQGKPRELHFDLQHNRVLPYSPTGNVNALASAMIKAALSFEAHLGGHVTTVTKRLSSDALAALNWYGIIQRHHPAMSLHPGNRGPQFEGEDGLLRFDAAVRELREKDLAWTDYKPKATSAGDAYGTHATEFGWLVIKAIWPELERPESDPNKVPQPARRARRRPPVRGQTRV
jgi:hypothetical protein